MKKSITVLGFFLIATILGMFAQGITDYIQPDMYRSLTYLTVITVGSYLFYLLAYTLLIFNFIKGHRAKNSFITYLYVLFSFIGIPVNMWSLFVLAMSHG